MGRFLEEMEIQSSILAEKETKKFDEEEDKRSCEPPVKLPVEQEILDPRYIGEESCDESWGAWEGDDDSWEEDVGNADRWKHMIGN